MGDGDVGDSSDGHDSSGAWVRARRRREGSRARCREAISTVEHSPTEALARTADTTMVADDDVTASGRKGAGVRSCDRIARGGRRLEEGKGSKKLTFLLTDSL